MPLKKISLYIVLLMVSTLLLGCFHMKTVNADILSLTLTSPDDNAHVLDTTPAFIFQPVSNVSATLINCTLYVADVASGDVSATNDTATSVTCNHTLTVAVTPYEWFINATDANETVKSAVRNMYIVPSTGPIDKDDQADRQDHVPDDSKPKDSKTFEIASTVAFFAVLIFVSTIFRFRKQFNRKHFRRR